MAITAPALPPTARTGIQPAAESRAEGPTASDDEVMSRLSASSGLDKIRDQRNAPAVEQDAPTDKSAGDPGEQVAGDESSKEAEGTAPDEFSLDVSDPADAPSDQTETATEAEPEKTAETKEPGKDLRSQLKHFSTQAKTLTKEKETLSRRLAELEAQVKEAPQSKTLAEQLTKREERIAELEKQIAYVDYTQSSDFVAKYQKPYDSKLQEAFKELQTLNKEDGSKPSNSEIESMLIGGEREAYRQIDEAFGGADARLASRLVSEVYGAARERERAISGAKTEATERTKQQEAARAQFREGYKAILAQNQEAIKAKYPDLYVPDPKDAERAGLFEQGYKLVDAAFHGAEKLSPEQRAKIEAEVYQRAGAFPALRLRALRAEKALAETKKELSRFKGNVPGRGEVNSDDSGSGSSGKQAEIGSKEWINQGLLRSQKMVK